MIFLSAADINNRIQKSENLTIIDIREPYELEISSLNCRNIPMGTIVDHIDELKSIENIVLMCRSGKRATSVANWLETDFHFSNIIVMEGGIIEWKEQVDPSLSLED